MVGTAARMRVSSVTWNFSSKGTLKSTRIKAFCPLKLYAENFAIEPTKLKGFRDRKPLLEKNNNRSEERNIEQMNIFYCVSSRNSYSFQKNILIFLRETRRKRGCI